MLKQKAESFVKNEGIWEWGICDMKQGEQPASLKIGTGKTGYPHVEDWN
jgi:hypothetical protein